MTTETPGVHTANKGEWSEIYAFFKMMDEKVLKSSDDSLNAIPEQFVEIYKIIRTEGRGLIKSRKIYDLARDKGSATILAEDGTVLKIVQLSGLRNGVKNILAAINDGVGAFEIAEADKLMTEFLCPTVKAASSDKSDIHLVIKDRHTPEVVESGFSIKSEFGAPPTLLNPSRHTTFLYEIVSESEIPQTEKEQGRVRDRVEAIYSAGQTLKFIETESAVFHDNLQLIDTVFPEIIAALLAQYYRNSGGTIEELVKLLPEDPSLAGYKLSLDKIEYKVKSFLEAIALGMTPSHPWDGHSDAQGGYIVVKEDGDLVCFHMYNRDKFRDYLYKNTKLDTPSTTRYGFGTEEKMSDGRRTLKLNLQIRFK
jgi:type II restriction enzyme